MNLKRFLKFKTILKVGIAFAAVSIICLYSANRYIDSKVRGRIYNSLDEVPYNHAGLLLGTSKYLRDGTTLNPYYQYRIEAAGELMKAGKLSYLVISGDNSRKDYNEPEDMRQSLIAMGIDSNRIFLDYAGFRTFDSVIRLREIFSQTKVTIISQPFHNERAVYIAGREDVDAIGYNARDVGKSFGFKVMLREKFARVKVFVDYLTFKKPKFLGPKVNIPRDEYFIEG
jgi:SanA protein